LLALWYEARMEKLRRYRSERRLGGRPQRTVVERRNGLSPELGSIMHLLQSEQERTYDTRVQLLDSTRLPSQPDLLFIWQLGFGDSSESNGTIMPTQQ